MRRKTTARWVRGGQIALAALLLAHMVSVFGNGCDSCAPADAWASAPPFDWSATHFGADSLGLEEGAAAPLVTEMGVEDSRFLLTIYRGGCPEEIAALGLAAEAAGLPVILSLSNFGSYAIQGISGLVGEGVVIIEGALAEQIQAAYHVGDTIGGGGVTFFVDEHARIALRRCDSPSWLIADDYAAVKAFAGSQSFPGSVLHQFVLEAGEAAPVPAFPLVDQEGKLLGFDEDLVRFFYDGPRPDTEKGALILDSLKDLQAEFPTVEFVWHLSYTSDEEMNVLWQLYNDAGIASLHPEWFELSLEGYQAVARSGRDEALLAETQSILASTTGWRLILDPGNLLGIQWCLRMAPYMMIIDADGVVRLPATFFPTDSAGGALRVHPEAQEALRQILADLVSG